MKYLIFLFLMLSACSTLSEYNRGCRDGVTGLGSFLFSQDKVNNYCDMLDRNHRAKEHGGKHQ